jgi:transposase
MARPKPVFTEELAGRAEADTGAPDGGGAVQKPKATAAVARLPAEAAGTVQRWAVAYARDGVAGPRRKGDGPRPSKLDAGQRATVLSWLEMEKTAKGEVVHWTLEGLRAAIAGEFGVGICANAIWVWLRKEGWRQKVPRPRRHAADAAAGARFRT